ncbi:MAG: ABC transporter substrate-binding protein [Desulfuromonadaceae bacterium]
MKNLYLLFVVIMLCITACTKQPEKAAQPQAPIQASLRLAWVYDMAEVGVLVAKERGFYAKEGIDLKIEPGGFGLDPFKLVAADSNDFGVGGAGNLLLAREKGVPVVSVGTEFQNTPVGFIVREESGISNFKNFRNKKVGVQTGSDTDVLYRALLTQNGMKSSDVKEIPIQFDMTPFVAKNIDVLPGYVTNQPITLAGKGVKTRVITAKSEGLNYYGNIFFVTEKTLKERPELVKRFMRATKAGWEHALTNKADAIAALKVYTKDFGDNDLDKIYDAVMPFIKPDEQAVPLLGMTRQRWESTQNVLTSSGLMKKTLDISSAYSSISY